MIVKIAIIIGSDHVILPGKNLNLDQIWNDIIKSNLGDIYISTCGQIK
jgi:hypothetical protein